MRMHEWLRSPLPPDYEVRSMVNTQYSQFIWTVDGLSESHTLTQHGCHLKRVNLGIRLLAKSHHLPQQHTPRPLQGGEERERDRNDGEMVLNGDGMINRLTGEKEKLHIVLKTFKRERKLSRRHYRQEVVHLSLHKPILLTPTISDVEKNNIFSPHLMLVRISCV